MREHLMSRRIAGGAVAVALLAAVLGSAGAAQRGPSTQTATGFDVVLSAQGEYLDAYFADGLGGFVKKVLVAPDDPAQGGRHLNGKVCFFPRNAPEKFTGKFVAADDTYREACVEGNQARCGITNPDDPSYVGTDPDGWGVFNRDATWARRVITTGTADNHDARGTADPQGCAFNDNADLIGNDVGSGSAGDSAGNIVMFFADGDYKQYCFLATNLPQPGQLVVDGGVVHVPLSGGGYVLKLAAPFPQSVDDCVPQTQPEGDVVLVPDAAHTPIVSRLVIPGAFTPSSMVRMPGIIAGSKTWYVASVLVTPTILEVIETPTSPVSIGLPIPIVLPFVPENPIGMDVATDGSALYYAELNLTLPDLGTGCGRVSLVRLGLGGGVLSPPQVIRDNLQFPDGITVLDSNRFDVDFNALPDAPTFSPADCSGSG
jgi:hypothetical protein